MAEAAGDHNAVEMAQLASGEKPFHVLRLDPLNLDIGAMVEPGVLQTLDHRQVGVGQLDVLADQANADRSCGGFNLGDELLPVREVDRSIESEYVADKVVEALVVQDERQLIDVVGVRCVDHGPLFHIAHRRDLALQVVGQRLFAATHDDVGLDSPAAQFGHRVLRRLGLLLAGRADEGNERDVDVADVVAAHHVAELANRLKERKDLNVADRAADFGDDHVDVVACDTFNASLDLVGDVRDDLHGFAEVVATSFGGQH